MEFLCLEGVVLSTLLDHHLPQRLSGVYLPGRCCVERIAWSPWVEFTCLEGVVKPIAYHHEWSSLAWKVLCKTHCLITIYLKVEWSSSSWKVLCKTNCADLLLTVVFVRHTDPQSWSRDAFDEYQNAPGWWSITIESQTGNPQSGPGLCLHGSVWSKLSPGWNLCWKLKSLPEQRKIYRQVDICTRLELNVCTCIYRCRPPSPDPWGGRSSLRWGGKFASATELPLRWLSVLIYYLSKMTHQLLFFFQVEILQSDPRQFLLVLFLCTLFFCWNKCSDFPFGLRSWLFLWNPGSAPAVRVPCPFVAKQMLLICEQPRHFIAISSFQQTAVA